MRSIFQSGADTPEDTMAGLKMTEEYILHEVVNLNNLRMKNYSSKDFLNIEKVDRFIAFNYYYYCVPLCELELQCSSCHEAQI